MVMYLPQTSDEHRKESGEYFLWRHGMMQIGNA